MLCAQKVSKSGQRMDFIQSGCTDQSAVSLKNKLKGQLEKLRVLFDVQFRFGLSLRLTD